MRAKDKVGERMKFLFCYSRCFKTVV